METWTVQKLLNWMKDYFEEKRIDDPRLSAELLLSHTLDCQRIELYTNFNRIVDGDRLGHLREMVKRAAAQEPIAYLVGRTEFYSLPMFVNKHCLIPRPETEMLVERAIEFLRRRPGTQQVLDLCTGSGCIAVAIAKNHSDCRVLATDICDGALAVAAENVRMQGLEDRIRLLCGDLFAPLIEGLDATRFDLITCNPPYVTTAEMERLAPNVRDYEPHKALHAGIDGLDVYRRIAEQVRDFLTPDGALLLEIGHAQGPAVRQLLEQTARFSSITIEKDYSNNDRVVTART